MGVSAVELPTCTRSYSYCYELEGDWRVLDRLTCPDRPSYPGQHLA